VDDSPFFRGFFDRDHSESFGVWSWFWSLCTSTAMWAGPFGQFDVELPQPNAPSPENVTPTEWFLHLAF